MALHVSDRVASAGGRLAVALSTAAAAVAVLFGLAATAYAHAAYDHSLPAESAVIDAGPELVEIWFAGPLVPEKPNTITVKGPDGKDVVNGDVSIGGKDNMQASVPLKPDLPDGAYKVAWKVYALDGMRAEGSYRFYLNVQPTEDDLAQDHQLRVDEQSQITAPDVVSDGGGISAGLIAIIAGVGGVAVLALGGAGFWLWRYYMEA